MPSELMKPLHWMKPRRIFVGSMGDLWNPAVPDGVVDEVYGLAGICPQHTFVALTKRPEFAIMYHECEYGTLRHRWAEAAKELLRISGLSDAQQDVVRCRNTIYDAGPMANVIIGVSVEDQDTADERIPLLLQIPAARRIVSYEPALAPVDWAPWIPIGLDGLVCGPETGPGARPCDPAWLQSAADQCRAAGVPFWLKKGTLPDGTCPQGWPT